MNWKLHHIPNFMNKWKKTVNSFYALALFGTLFALSALLTGCGVENKSISKQAFAMDTFMTVEAYGKNADDATDKAIEEINRIDHLWSIGFEDSEISSLNSQGTLDVSKDTYDVINRIAQISRDTDDAIDLTVLPLMELWGFTTKDYSVPTKEEIQQSLLCIGMDNIIIKTAENTNADSNLTHTVNLRNDAKLDLGAVAKGYTTDRIKDILISEGIESALINLGGNVYALGYKPVGGNDLISLKTGKTDWTLAIENPNTELFSSSVYLGILKLHDKALVTSGDYNRFFIESGKKYHHIMDPKTGYPAESGIISVSIISSDATLADALSTALFVMGKDKALKYWESHNSLFDTVIVESNGDITITEGIKDCFSSDYSYSVYNAQ